MSRTKRQGNMFNNKKIENNLFILKNIKYDVFREYLLAISLVFRNHFKK